MENKVSKEKNLQRPSKMIVYRVFRVVLGTIYRLWYRPKIKGSENIPKEGAIVVVGNHIHIMDQCNVIISTRRKIHYMAKKEYFDPQYKEGHYGWFFRSAGCIPVDRKIHDDDAKEAALEVLREKHALGLFPEGTRNGLKEERVHELYGKYIDSEKESFDDFSKRMKKVKNSQITYLEELLDKKKIKKDEFIAHIDSVDSYLKELVHNKVITKDDYYEHIYLPFKFGAVSMAHKTDALVVPFVVTGEYKFLSKNLNVVIGKPMKVSDDLEKSNNELRKVMIDLYKESEKNEW